MIRWLTLLLSAVLIVSIIAPLKDARAEAAPQLKLNFDRTFYSLKDNFTASGTAINASSATRPDTILRIVIYPSLDKGGRLLRPFHGNRQPLFEETKSLTLPRGLTKITMSRNIEQSALAEGVYPAEFRAEVNGATTFVSRSYLVIIEPRSRPLPVAVTWNLHEAERRNTDGVFTDNALAEMLDPDPSRPGSLDSQLEAIAETSGAIANVSVSSTLIEQLKSMASGYTWMDGRRLRQVRWDAPDAMSAADWLDRLAGLIANGQVEIMAAPYGDAPLPALTKLGWADEAADQITLGLQQSAQTWKLADQTPGLYLPGLLIDERTARLAGASNVPYAVALLDNGAESSFTPGRANVIRKSAANLVIFPADAEISDWLPTAHPQDVRTELTALLAERTLSSDNRDIVVMASRDPGQSTRADLMRQIDQTIDSLPWADKVHLSSKLDQAAEPAEFSTAQIAPRIDPDYRQSLIRARKLLNTFLGAVSADNDLGRRLKRTFYKSQSIDSLAPPDERRPIGTTYADFVTETIEKEFNKVELAPPRTITFSTPTGKIPVAIYNRATYPIRARLTLRGKGFTFEDEKQDTIVLKPKENLISYNVTAGFPGLNDLDVQISVGDLEIASREVEVTVSSLLRYIVVTVTTAIFLGVGALIVLRGRQR